jgi:hypothetical protein
MSMRHTSVALIAVLVLLPACHGDGASSDNDTGAAGTDTGTQDTGADSGTDGDADSDSDSDADSDADGDGDSDAGTGCGECVLNSGFPCVCSQVDHCDDGSACGIMDTDSTEGACFTACTSDTDCVTDMPCTAYPMCFLMGNDGSLYCGYVCEGPEDCPSNMACNDLQGMGICYPH